MHVWHEWMTLAWPWNGIVVVVILSAIVTYCILSWFDTRKRVSNHIKWFKTGLAIHIMSNMYGCTLNDLEIAIKWCLKVQLWSQMASNHDLVHGNEFPVPENGIEHVSHIYISTKCVCTTNLPLKWRPSWIFAHRESSGQGKIGENMFLYSRDVRHWILKKSAL